MSEANARATLEALGAVVGEGGHVLDAPCQVGGIPLLGRASAIMAAEGGPASQPGSPIGSK